MGVLCLGFVVSMDLVMELFLLLWTTLFPNDRSLTQIVWQNSSNNWKFRSGLETHLWCSKNVGEFAFFLHFLFICFHLCWSYSKHAACSLHMEAKMPTRSSRHTSPTPSQLAILEKRENYRTFDRKYERDEIDLGSRAHWSQLLRWA